MLLLLIGAGVIAILRNHLMLVTNPLDFRAFYCAGKGVLAAANPYLAEPLRSCEADAARMAGLSSIRYLAIPAPLPGYALPLFMLAAKIDFISASTLFAIASVVAVGITVVALWRLTSLPIVTIFATLILSDGYVGLVNGQVVPIFVMLLCLAALACELDRPWLAAFCCASAAIEPHLALPACVSLALFFPRARLPLAVFAIVLAAISLATLGIARNAEYLTSVLPAQVASEATNAGQYSLTSLLFNIGVPVGAAIRAGEVSYVIMVLAGLITTGMLCRKRGGAAFIVVIPVAFALLGGSYIHVVQIAAAIPAALLLVARYPLPRPMVVTALCLLAIPWLSLVRLSSATPTGVLAAATLISAAVVWPLLRKSAVSYAVVLTAALIVYSAGLFALWAPAIPAGPDAVPAMMRVADGRELAETTWALYERISLSHQSVPIVVAKLPTWLGLMLLLTFAIRVRARTHRSTETI